MTQLWISIFGYEYLEFTTIVDIHNSVMETITGVSSVLNMAHAHESIKLPCTVIRKYLRHLKSEQARVFTGKFPV